MAYTFQFTSVSKGSSADYILQSDGWNDFGYLTLFNVFAGPMITHTDTWTKIGYLRIGVYGSPIQVDFIEMIPRGMYLKSGTSSISEVGTGKIAAGGRTVGQMVVSKISVTVKVERLVNGSWASYTSWSEEKSNAALVSSSKTLTVPIGYYYRVYCRHYANTDASGSYTDGIHI